MSAAANPPRGGGRGVGTYRPLVPAPHPLVCECLSPIPEPVHPFGAVQCARCLRAILEAKP